MPTRTWLASSDRLVAAESEANAAQSDEFPSVSSAVAIGRETRRVAVRVVAPAIALIVTVCADALLVVVTENVPVVAPWATVILAGTDATALSLERFTAKPPARAGFVRVTVPVEGEPPGVDVGFKESADSTGSGGVTVSVAVRTMEAAVAVIVIDWVAATPVVVTAKVATVEP
jgi:hypothetical protein